MVQHSIEEEPAVQVRIPLETNEKGLPACTE